MSFILRRFFATTPPTMESAQQKAQKLIDENAVVVFSKSWCPYCRNAKRILDGLNAKYTHLELDEEKDGAQIQDALFKMTQQRTVPNIFIGKTHIGGNSDLEDLVGKDLNKLLKDAGAL